MLKAGSFQRIRPLEILRHAKFNWHKAWMNTYGFEYYLYAKVLVDSRLRHLEVPVTMRYPEKGKRYSKIQPVKGWYEMLKPWVVARFDGGCFAADMQLPFWCPDTTDVQMGTGNQC